MTDPGGGFYSSLDADSEGHEGAFYVWTPDQVTAALWAKDGAFFCSVYGITTAGNFEGKSIPNLIEGDLEMRAKASDTTEDALALRLAPMRAKLLAARAKRPRPATDDKVLTAWNGLMITAFALGLRGVRAGGRPGLRAPGRRLRARKPAPGIRPPARRLEGRARPAERLPRRSRLPRRAARPRGPLRGVVRSEGPRCRRLDREDDGCALFRRARRVRLHLERPRGPACDAAQHLRRGASRRLRRRCRGAVPDRQRTPATRIWPGRPARRSSPSAPPRDARPPRSRHSSRRPPTATLRGRSPSWVPRTTRGLARCSRPRVVGTSPRGRSRGSTRRPARRRFRFSRAGRSSEVKPAAYVCRHYVCAAPVTTAASLETQLDAP